MQEKCNEFKRSAGAASSYSAKDSKQARQRNVTGPFRQRETPLLQNELRIPGSYGTGEVN